MSMGPAPQLAPVGDLPQLRRAGWIRSRLSLHEHGTAHSSHLKKSLLRRGFRRCEAAPPGRPDAEGERVRVYHEFGSDLASTGVAQPVKHRGDQADTADVTETTQACGAQSSAALS